jgi:membrane associated rhomboid family serine protease
VLREDRYRKRLGLGQDGNSLVMLIAILAIIFCIFQFIGLVYFLSDKKPAGYEAMINWLTLPASFSVLVTKPWTLITYMFVHEEVWHMLPNLLWLWAFGYIFQDLTGNKKLIPLFVYGGIAGGLFYMLCFNVFPAFTPVVNKSTLIGASAGVMAIAVATTTLAPDYRIFPMINGGIPLWVLTVLYVIVDLAGIRGSNGGGHLSHLGGAAIGFVFIHQLRRNRDWSAWMNNLFDWIGNLFNPDKQNWKKTARTDLHYKTRGTQPYKKIPNITQKRIDEILDKINQQGYRFLTEEEKDILKRAAEDEEL